MCEWVRTMEDKSEKWLKKAGKFIDDTFPDLHTGTRVVPPLCGDIQPSLVNFLCEFGRQNGLKEDEKEFVYIVYSRDIKQLVKTRFSGGQYERLEKIQEVDHDIIIINQRWGLFCIKVFYVDENKWGGTNDPRHHLIQKKCENAKTDFNHIRDLMMEAGMKKKKEVDKWFPLHFPIIAFPSIRKEGKLPQNPLVLYKEDCQSQAEFGKWWNDRVIGLLKKKLVNLDANTHKTMLTM